MAAGRRVIGLLDIGSFKITCVIVAETGAASAVPGSAAAPAAFRVAGVGYQRSRGVKAGVVTDLDQAEAAVRATIAQAERMAGVTLREVVLSVSCGRLKSENFAAAAEVAGRVVTDEDIARLIAGGRAHAERDGRTLVHLNRLGFRLDGVSGMQDPRGMAARKLAADLHAVTADDGPVRNLLMVIERCYLTAAGLIPAALASAIATCTEEERRLGVTCIDIGGGCTTFAVFSEGRFLSMDSLPMGGSHITFDIARALQTPLAEAERIKALYGTLVSAQSDEHELLSYPLAGAEDGALAQTSKARLAAVVRPRVQSLLGQVRERLNRSGLAPYAGEQVVLTGGGSQLVGMTEFANVSLGKTVRVGRPLPLSGMPSATCGPAFSSVVGLLGAAVMAGSEAGTLRDPDHLVQSYLGRVSQWLKQGF
ncbi:MAG: cell division protein FtsA [Hyphomicrobium sp.]